jgi:hypothetical protein
MRKLIFLLLLAASLNAAPATEQGSFEVVANAGSRVTVVKVYFSKPFRSMPKCVATFTKAGVHAHGEGELQEYTRTSIQILAEVGEKVSWVCRGER